MPARRRAPAVRARAEATLQALVQAFPDPRCELLHRSPYELLVATVLSAQATDKGVNKVTPALFAKYPTVEDLARAVPAELEALVASVNYYRTKARHLRQTAGILVEKHGGEVPRTMEELVALPGVARKTATVVLGTGYGIAEGITVDTHARRVTRRLGLTREDDPVKVERDLMGLFLQDQWIALGHRLVLFGRYTCTARSPACHRCPCQTYCPAQRSLVRQGMD